MTTRALVAAGLAAAVMTQIAPARAQQNTGVDVQAGVGVQAQGPGNVNIPTPPPADRPLIRRLPPARIVVEGGAGVLGYVGGTAGLGPAWNLRVADRLTDRWELEANYTGSANRRADDAGTLLYTALDGDARFNILRASQAPVTPFVAAGIGFASYAGKGGSPLALTLPLYVGADRMLTRNIKIGARFNLRPSFFENLAYGGERNAPGGDTWSLVANMGGAF